MKHFLKLFLVLFVILISTTACNKNTLPDNALERIKLRDKIIVGTKFDARPFGYIDQNQVLKGYEIDIAKAIAKKLLGDENKVEFKQVLPSNRILALSAGEVDMLIATMTITSERQKVITFTNPYFITGLSILVPKNSSINTITDLNNRPTILILGTTGEKDIRTLAPEAKIYGFRTYTDGYSALKAGRADAMITDKSILLGITLNDSNYKVLPKTYTVEPYGIALRKGEDSESLRIELNEILKTLQKTGELKKLNNRWGLNN